MSGVASAREVPASAEMMHLLTGKWIARGISVAAELGIADLLATGEKTTEELAQATSTHAPSVYRLLRALSSMGIFAETEDRRFRLTPLAECLRSDAPDSVRDCARFHGAPLAWRAWEELTHSVKTGETGLSKAVGSDPWEYLAAHPDDAAIFHGAMTDYSRLSAPAIAQGYDFNRFDTIADIAGGHGLLLLTILSRYPRPNGIVFDLPDVVPGARAAIARAGMESRCQAENGDFFQSVPKAHAYILKHIIHDWPDEKAVTILRTIRRSIHPTGRLFLAESVVLPGNEPCYGKLIDLEMLAMAGGQERTAEEYRSLLERSGFKLLKIHSTEAPEHLVEATPVAD